MMIPIFKPTPGEEELRELKDTFDSHWIGLGPKTKKFEKEFCEYTGCKNAISLNSCTAALHLALLALGIKEGDEVLIPAITFASTGHTVIFTGAVPILVDVNEDDLQMNIEDLKKKITSRTKAIIPVHYGGIICDMDPILEIARTHGLYVIEDAANACGGEYKNKKIGSLGSNFACFSFEAKKNMTTGDGGMLTTNHDGKIVDKINRLKWVGMDKDTAKRFSGEGFEKPWEYDITDLGFKYNMNDINASMGLVQLKKLDAMNNARRRLVKRYDEHFKSLGWLRTIIEKPYSKNVYWLYILRIDEKDRDNMMKHLLQKEVSANTSFKPLHLFSFYKDYYTKRGIKVVCPVAEREWEKLFVLPLYPSMSDVEQDKVIRAVKSFKEVRTPVQDNYTFKAPDKKGRIVTEERTEEKDSKNRIVPTGFKGLFVVHPQIHLDNRGYFYENFNKREFNKAGLPTHFIQDSQSMSKKWVLRGMHLQKFPFEQDKLVRVDKGKVLDVVVDLRKNSVTYGKWFSIELSAENKKMLLVPKGFAHGFLSLEEDTIVNYKFTNVYNPNAYLGIRWDDPDVAIDWQLDKYGAKKEDLIISEKDRILPGLKEVFKRG